MNEQAPLPYGVAVKAEARCIGQATRLITSRRVRLLEDRVGMRLRFADGTSARVYRETVVLGVVPDDACILLVEFRLFGVRGWGHRIFRAESLLNTPLFVGYPGFVSKLWLAHDEKGRYRGLYEWDGAERAEYYARSLWRVLGLVSHPPSIHYHVLPSLRRDALLEAPGVVKDRVSGEARAWWRLVEARR